MLGGRMGGQVGQFRKYYTLKILSGKQLNRKVKILVMSQFQSKHRPPSTTFQKEDILYHGITTRVMATKHIIQIQKDLEEREANRSPIRRNSKFLSGTSIPNSTIRSSLVPTTKIELTAQESNKSLHSTKTLNNSLEEEAEKKRLSAERGMERMRKKIRGSTTTQSSSNSGEQRKWSSRKLPDLYMPQRKMRRPTLESIKNAIDKSDTHVVKLVNADSIEKHNVGQHFKLLTLDSLPFQQIVAPAPNPVQEATSGKRDFQTQTSFTIETFLMQN